MKIVKESKIIFEEKDVFGRRIRTTKNYWQKIFLIKHKELKVSKTQVIEVIKKPDEVRKSVQDPFIYLFYKKIGKKNLVVVIKYLNNHGFVVTIYETSKVKRKGEKIWPK
ncbi:MAG: DUF4258 domain-containing protein [Candidatus Omnitrophica bacterium]|nr:DUF4258 domain-containing protein [Candidatus Omnitrophota bacterium]